LANFQYRVTLLTNIGPTRNNQNLKTATNNKLTTLTEIEFSDYIARQWARAVGITVSCREHPSEDISLYVMNVGLCLHVGLSKT